MRESSRLLTVPRVLTMNYEVAKELIEHLKAVDVPMNAAMHAADKVDDPVRRKEVRKALARVVGMIYTDIMVPIGKEFPDLLPKDTE